MTKNDKMFIERKLSKNLFEQGINEELFQITEGSSAIEETSEGEGLYNYYFQDLLSEYREYGNG
jgi:hypothetical protein